MARWLWVEQICCRLLRRAVLSVAGGAQGLARAFTRHSVLVIRDQGLDAPRFLAAMQNFGEVFPQRKPCRKARSSTTFLARTNWRTVASTFRARVNWHGVRFDPLVRTHPESGREAIYINPICVEAIVGMVRYLNRLTLKGKSLADPAICAQASPSERRQAVRDAVRRRRMVLKAARRRCRGSCDLPSPICHASKSTREQPR